jgi:mitochondrial import receptor subunit TOM40
MASSSVPESLVPPQPAPSASPAVAPSYFRPISPLWNALDRFNQWRADLGLPHPGSAENLQKEVKGACFFLPTRLSPLLTRPSCPGTHLTNYMFDGARADLTKSLSMNPLFQVTHSFALGSQTLPSSYNFGAIFANSQVRGFRTRGFIPSVLKRYCLGVHARRRRSRRQCKC